MDDILHGYSVNEPTWFYLSLLLIIAVFFRFGRVWSLKNLDLVLLLAISPGILLIDSMPALGHTWLFVGTGLFLLRLLCDGLFKRRPRLEQNMNVSGLAFLGISALAVMTTRVILEPPPPATVETVGQAEQLLSLKDDSQLPAATLQGPRDAQMGPASRLIAAPVVPLSKAVGSTASFEQTAARIIAIVAHLAVITGLIMLAKLHFGDVQLGVAMATLYLLLPCTSYHVGKVNHVLPTALIVWALVAYRRPMAAGSLMGLACGTLFFPIFLLPLWAAYYGRRGALRFGVALGLVGAILLGSLVLTSADTHSFTRQMIGSIDWGMLKFQGVESAGFWHEANSAYRIPVFATFGIITFVLTIWPRRKNLEHLIAHSAAIIVATQFWYPQQGGAYLLWYLPLMLIVVFRPQVCHLHPQSWQAAPPAPTGTIRRAPSRREYAGSAATGNQIFR
jgi:hypothetical protein